MREAARTTMLTAAELLRAVLLPAVVAVVLTLVARWRRWEWAVPWAIAGGFFIGWTALRGFPTLDPRDGTDQLFWLSAITSSAAIAVWELGRRSRRFVPLFLAVATLSVGNAFGGV